LTFGEVCREVEKLVGTATITPQPRRSNGVRLKAEWETAKKIQVGTPVAAYLKERGLKSGSRHLRFLERALGENVGAMMAEITDEKGEVLGFHYTYVCKKGGRWVKADVEPPKRTRKTGTTISGGSIKLFGPERGLIGLTEGIETALAVRQLFGTPTWACMSTAGLVKVRIPETVRRVLVYADNDENFAGQKAAYELANRLKVKDGFEGSVEVQICPMVGGDYLDALVSKYFGKIERGLT
jgi:putative DNA primase/helicase